MQPLSIDGSFGEGGGQIVRAALTVSLVSGQPVYLERIRAGRPKPGLQAQHLSTVRAAAALCDAEVEGDALGSERLRFTPRRAPAAGDYTVDIALARPGGSAGAVTLLAQTLIIPLALTGGRSRLLLRGGTHTTMSPPFDDLAEVYLATLPRMGVLAAAELTRWGWYPAGGGEIHINVGPARRPLVALDCRHRGALVRVSGHAAASQLEGEVAERITARAHQRLRQAGINAELASVQPRATCPGAGLFLCTEYERSRAGFSALGERGKPAETVADEAVDALLAFHRSGAAFDHHLADQLLLPAAFAGGVSVFTVERATSHLRTVAGLLAQWGLADVRIEASDQDPGTVTVTPRG